MSTFLRQAVSSSVARFHSTQTTRRAFISSDVGRKDVVQDIYLREIRAYRPAAIAKDAHVGVVKQYALPPSPKAPTLPVDLAKELAAYDATEPAVPSDFKSTTTESASGADAFLSFLEMDPPKPEVSHH